MDIKERIELQRAFAGQPVSVALNWLIADIDKKESYEPTGGNGRVTNSDRLTQTGIHIINEFERQGSGLRSTDGAVYLYMGLYWESLTPDQLAQIARDGSLSAGIPEGIARSRDFIEGLIGQFRADATPTPDIQKGSVKFPLKDMVIEVSPSGVKEVEDNPNDFFRFRLPFNYDPEATCENWQKFLHEVIPDQEAQRVVQEFMGYCLMPHGAGFPKLEKAMIFLGEGSNGKGVFQEVMKGIFGSSLTEYALPDLLNDRGDARLRIAGKLVNYGTELSPKLMNSEIFKRLVSGETVEGRFLYQESVIIKNYAKLIFNANNLPFTGDHSHGFFRRFIIVPFARTFSGSEIDPNLPEELLKSDASGIFNWILEGYNRISEQRSFSESATIENTLNEYRYETDNVAQYISHYGYEKEPEDGLFMIQEVMYEEFVKEFMLGRGNFSRKEFTKQLRRLGFEIRRRKQNVVLCCSTGRKTS